MSSELRRGPSGPPADIELTTDSIENVSTLPGDTLTDVLDTFGSSSVENDSTIPGETVSDVLDDLASSIPAGTNPTSPAGTPGSPFNPGYLSRFVWVDPASDRIGTTFAGVTVEATPTVWTTAAQIPPGDEFWWVQYGAAGGSGSGAADRSSSGSFSINGGGPSGGGYRHEWRCTRQDLIAALPISFQTPLGGDPGASVSSSTNVTVPGNPGVNGSANLISGTGLRQFAGGSGFGAAGIGGTTGAAGLGGGQLTSANGGTTAGAPNDATSAVGGTTYNQFGSSLSTRTLGATGNASHCVNGGASGGSCGNVNSIVPGGRSLRGGCGGGHGGRFAVGGVGLIIGSDGGNHDVATPAVTGGGGLAGQSNGAPGSDGADGTIFEGGQGGGGGFPGSLGTAGGAGGRGGFPGGGSGGGGSCYGSQLPGNAVSGAGRRGADGCTILTVIR